MIQEKLAQSFNVARDVVTKKRMKDLSSLASQTSLEERESLYAVTRYVYSGEGDVWDLGCAAGGSSFCLGAGIQDNDSIANEDRMVKCFDLFSGYSRRAFRNEFPDKKSDLDIFYLQTGGVAIL